MWRPLMARGGLAVISELSWFTEHRPAPAVKFWQAFYPAMGDEEQNIDRAARTGFRAVLTERLPADAWWRNYYGPLRERIRQMDATPANRRVLRETTQEIGLFERYSRHYGYTYYVLAAVDGAMTTENCVSPA